MPKPKKNEKMLLKFMQNVAVNIAGKQAEDMVPLLNNQKHVNEFIIAKKLDITVNQVRNILYKLSDFGVVSFIRKKDKRKGWYTYFWRIEPLKSLEVLKELFEVKIAQVNNQISQREKDVFYICERCNIEMNEENSLLNDFTCPECGGIFIIRDNSKLLKEMKKNLSKYEEEMVMINEEISKEADIKEVAKQKERKKEDSLKKAVRAKAQKARKEARDKLKGKKPEKKSVKKSGKAKKVKKLVGGKSRKVAKNKSSKSKKSQKVKYKPKTKKGKKT
ncbi:hypothetical protein COU59_02545 [Candidatus Pacearchaeota archaeon CG10_big_fil_rev_8_21_14_0_10_34_12]|nr:MAG: hypothetical protein COU59_02545 [Candidatus Pacearchaeota archaeon CG10_big_fil_rev_8_21_14_0_10_34_12]